MRRLLLILAFATAIAAPAMAQIRFDFGGDERGEHREHGDRGEYRHSHDEGEGEHREWSGEHHRHHCRWMRDEDGEPVKVCR
jgi:hypothetical protein